MANLMAVARSRNITGRTRRRVRQYARMKKRRNPYRRTSRNSFAGRVRAQVLALNETKLRSLVLNDTSTHAGTVVTITQLGSVTRGDTPGQRIADNLIARYYWGKFTFSNLTANPLYIRVLTFWTTRDPLTGEQIHISETDDDATIGATVDGTMRVLYSKPTRKCCQIISDRVFYLSANTMEHRCRSMKTGKKLNNKKIMFENNNTGSGNQNYQIVTVFYAFSPNLPADVAGQTTATYKFNAEERFYFKDP